MITEPTTPDLSLNEPTQVNTAAHSHLATESETETITGITAAPQATSHSFSRTFARVHGVKAAIICGYLAHRINTTHKQGQGYKVTIDELASHYPYMSRSAIASVLTKMCNSENPVLKVHQKNHFGFDRTCHYAFTNVKLITEAGRDRILFNIDEAVKYGICGAVILTNIRMRTNELRATNPELDWYRFSARNMVKYLPFERATLNRSLNSLAEANVIELKPPEGRDRAYSCRLRSFFCADQKPHMNGPDPEMNGTNPNTIGSEVNINGTNPNDNTSLKVIIGRASLEFPIDKQNTYEGRAASPDAPSKSFDSFLGTSDKSTIVLPPPQPGTSGGAPGGKAKGTGNDKTPHVTFAQARRFLQLPSWRKPVHPINITKLTDPQPRQEAPVSINPFGEPIINPTDHISNSPVKQPAPESFDELVAKNNQRWQVVGTKEQYIFKLAFDKCTQLLTTQTAEFWFQLIQLKTHQEVYDKVRPLVAACHHKMAEYFNYGGMVGVDDYLNDFLVRAIHTYTDPEIKHLHPQARYMQAQLETILTPYIETNRELLQKKGLRHVRFGEQLRQERYQSPDKDKERLDYLSAAEKRKVLENAINSTNRIGEIMDNGRRCHKVIQYNKQSLKAAERFFEANLDYKVEDLHTLLHICWDISVNQPDPGGYGDHWYVRRGNDLTFLLVNMEKIVNSEEIQTFDLQPDAYLPKYELFSTIVKPAKPHPDTEPLTVAA